MRLFHTGVRMNPKKIRRLMWKNKLFCPVRKANPYHRLQKAIQTNNTTDNLLRQSMSRRGSCWDNAPQESFFVHMRDELAHETAGWSSF